MEYSLIHLSSHHLRPYRFNFSKRKLIYYLNLTSVLRLVNELLAMTLVTYSHRFHFQLAQHCFPDPEPDCKPNYRQIERCCR